VVYESGKCISCGICVRTAESNGEKFGPAFIGRGFEVVVGGALGRELEDSLAETASLCVKRCPTGALAFRDD